MLISLHYCKKDEALALSLAEWLAEIGPFPNHDLLLSRDRRTSKSLVVMFGLCGFRSVNEIVIADDTADSWPASANHALQRIAKHIQYKLNGQSFLHLEPDAVVLRGTAFDEVESEYKTARAAGKFFLGDLQNEKNNKRVPDFQNHCSGVSVMPGHLTEHAGDVFYAEDTPWDIYAAHQIYPLSQQSELIFHNWDREGNGLAPFASWQDFERKVLSRRPKCAVFHADKLSSLIPILRARRNNLPALVQAESVEGAQKPALVELQALGPEADKARESTAITEDADPPSDSCGGQSPSSWHDQTPWESHELSVVEIRRIAARLKQFQTSSPKVRYVRSLLHEAGVITLTYRHKKRKGWRKKK